MKLRIPTMLSCRNIIKFVLYFICFERLLEAISLPHAIIFILDIANLILLLNLMKNKHIIKYIKEPIIASQLVVIVTGCVVALFNGVRPILVLWAMRNLCRFWIFFLSCKCYLREKDVESIFRSFEVIFYLNFVILLGQYAIGYRGDFLGGLFGITTGANVYCNLFLLIVCTYNIVRWFEKKEKIDKLIRTLVVTILIAAITETKILFIEIAILFVITFILTCMAGDKKKMLLRALGVAGVGAIMLLIGVRIMIKMYPNFANFFTIEGFLYHTTRESGYSGYGDLNRLTAIKTINQSIFTGSGLTRILGMGLGSTEYASAGFLTSSFYTRYGYLHYYWFSHSWMYLENGYFGLILYIAGFLFNGLFGVKNLKKYKNQNEGKTFLMVGIVLSFMTAMLYLYNQSMRLEAAFWLYFCFAVMNIGGKYSAERTIK